METDLEEAECLQVKVLVIGSRGWNSGEGLGQTVRSLTGVSNSGQGSGLTVRSLTCQAWWADTRQSGWEDRRDCQSVEPWCTEDLG